MTEAVTAFVDWPHAPLTKCLVEQALNSLPHPFNIQALLPKDFAPNPPTKKLIQWATYDSIDHELTARARDTVLSSSYIFRKALIRKHFLSQTIRYYVTKHPGSPLVHAVPRTWEIELSFVDELDEMWTDELFDLAEFLGDQSGSIPRWYILKPGMADRGMGIRLFNSKEGLRSIFEEFEENEDAEDEDESSDTGVLTSQLRHFVVQVCEQNTRYPTSLSHETEVPCEPPPTGSGAKCREDRRQPSGAQGGIIPWHHAIPPELTPGVQSSTFGSIALLLVLLKYTFTPGYWLSFPPPLMLFRKPAT
jgi:tubulin---tyrosine ligase